MEEVLTGWLAGRRLLLVVDNCEHVLDAVGVLLEQLLSACPELTVLATSRSRLLLPFELAYAVPGLSVTATDDRPPDAVELFLRRAAAGGSVVQPADLDRVAAVCRGLDGMALAIELAAARLPALGLDGLETGLGDRLDLLAGGSRVDGRHRSLRSALDWSYALLGEPERALLRRVSVIAGPFSSSSAVEMLGGWDPVATDQVPALLARLADQSLLVADPDRTGHALRRARDDPAVRRRPARRCRRDGCRARSPPALVPGGGRAAGRAGTVGPGRRHLAGRVRRGLPRGAALPAVGAVRTRREGDGLPAVTAHRRAEPAPGPARGGATPLRAGRRARARRRGYHVRAAAGGGGGRRAPVRQRVAPPAGDGSRRGTAGR